VYEYIIPQKNTDTELYTLDYRALVENSITFVSLQNFVGLNIS